MFKAREVALSWAESQKHHLALDELEDKTILSLRGTSAKKISASLEKKIKAACFNVKNQYLREKELTMRHGIFYKTVQDE